MLTIRFDRHLFHCAAYEPYPNIVGRATLLGLLDIKAVRQHSPTERGSVGALYELERSVCYSVRAVRIFREVGAQGAHASYLRRFMVTIHMSILRMLSLLQISQNRELLGGVTSIREITIDWPASGKSDVFKDLKIDRGYII